jgi:hypothetical protein
MRAALFVAGFLAVSACAPTVPNSAAGVGFGDYDAYQNRQAEREAALAGLRQPAGGAESAGTRQSDEQQLAAEALAAVRPGAVLDTGPIVPQGAAAPAGIGPTTPRISDEQDFDAVAARETIESDAERLRRQAAQYQIVEPEALPQRSGGSRPNIVRYALDTTHPVGTKIHPRSGLGGSRDRTLRNCASYVSPDLAQEDFLARGGPQRDRRGLDPDGDGYACGWDPTPFRAALGN